MSTWYSDGTIEVAEGGDVATGAGTAFLANVRVGDGIAIAGSATLHEVTNIASNQQLTFQPPFAGQAGSALAYRIAPVQGYVKRAADRLAQIVAEYGDTLAALGDEETRQLVIELAENITPAGLELTSKATAGEQRQVLGLERVDNTPDAEKPVSAPQLQALDAKADAEDVATALAGKADADQTAQALAGKVDKEDGKGLSQANYTQGEKDKLATLDIYYQGLHGTLEELQASKPVGKPGDYADIDAGPGVDVNVARWDESDQKWVLRQSSDGQSMTDSEVRAAYLRNPDTNNYSDDDKAKVDGVDAGAQVNADAVSQAEVQAGTSTALRSWSVLRVWQAIQAWWNASAMKTKLDAIPTFPPADGKSYVWTNGAWVESQQGGGGGELLSVEFFHGYRSALATERPGCLPIDGQLLTRSMWPEAIGKILAGNLYPLQPSDTAWNSSWANKRQFSPGDGSTTVRMMDWNGATGGKAVLLRGSPADSFSLKEDMLQNITGTFYPGMGNSGANLRLPEGSGAFRANRVTGSQLVNVTSYSSSDYTGSIDFDASRVARTGDETVPPRADGVWIIRMAKAGAGSNPGTVDVTALASEVAALPSKVPLLIKETYYRTPGAISHVMNNMTSVYEVEVWSGGEGAGTPHSPGGSSSFGAITVTGAAGNATPGMGFGSAPGVASGGLLNLRGSIAGGIDVAGRAWASTGAAAPRGGSGGGASLSSQPRPIDGDQPGGGGGALGEGQTFGSSGGYSFDRKAVVGGTTITGMVGAGGAAGTNGGKGGDGMIIVREYSSNLPGVDVVNQLISEMAARMRALGDGQTRVNFNLSTERVKGVTYTNTTGRTILVSVFWQQSSTAEFLFYVNGVQAGWGRQNNVAGGGFMHTFILPGETYSCAGGNAVTGWSEIR